MFNPAVPFPWVTRSQRNAEDLVSNLEQEAHADRERLRALEVADRLRDAAVR